MKLHKIEYAAGLMMLGMSFIILPGIVYEPLPVLGLVLIMGGLFYGLHVVVFKD